MESNQEVLRRYFALVDASYGFVAKHRSSPTVRSVLRVANSFGSSQLTRQHLLDLAAVAPDLLILKRPKSNFRSVFDDLYSPTVVDAESIEIVTFPLAPQPSQRASTKRKALFHVALEKKLTERNSPRHNQEHQVSNHERDEQISTNSPILPNSPISTSTEHLSLQSDWGSLILTMLQQMDLYKDQIAYVECRESRDAQYRALHMLQLAEPVCKALKKCYNIHQLYSHQFEAIDAICRGENAVLSTATASGKSLAYNVPMLDMLLKDPNATFIYMFPTKALAQDQLKSLRRFLKAADLPLYVAATFDGDTPMKSRSMIIRETRVFLTNPDMLHLTILPHHRQWIKVLKNMRLLVVDEAHMYRGVFGSHVSCVFRRLFRLCALYGSNPQVICCSATIQNPKAHFNQLLPTLPQQLAFSTNDCTDADTKAQSNACPPSMDFFHQRPLKVITNDGAPSVRKLFCIWNPKNVKPAKCTRKSQSVDAFNNNSSGKTIKKRKRLDNTTLSNCDSKEPNEKVSFSTSAIYHGSRLLARFVEAEIATLLFCRGRKLTELVLMNVHSILDAKADTRHLRDRVTSYRGGYTLETRRRIEQRLFSGDLLGVVATNALELGIDIGELDCTIHLGFPSSVASLWQQAGRAGRRHEQARTKHSVAVIVCFDAPLDQHFARKQNAMELFQLEPEAVSLNPMNHRILEQHLLCAARESALYSPQSGTAYIDSFVFGKLNDNSNTGGENKQMSDVSQVLSTLLEDRKLVKYSEGSGQFNLRIHSCMPKKFRTVSLRSICDQTYTVVVTNKNMVKQGADLEVLDEIPDDKAFFQVYPTAVYLHQAQEYLITRLDHDQRTAYAEKCPEPLAYFTTCRDFTDLEVVRIHTVNQLQGSNKDYKEDSVLVYVGTVSIVTRVFGSTMLEKRTTRIIGMNEFNLPPLQSFGEAVWLELPRLLRDKVEETSGRSWTAALHGVGHLFVALIRLFVLCDAEDVGTEHVNDFEQRIKPNRVTIFERREGGSGLVPEIVKALSKIIKKAWTIASECLCSDGCPACIQSTGCSEYNHALDKHGSLQVLDYLHSIVNGENS
ncbi:hypothetical protein CCR75_001416 [Bremia lactucae]|uniref:Uncharacterized protein n=1 Tax=Bremia lactucae TaxID=4779 RepID=A0A976FKE1_BRELC|nr:hypothetical protein CCR75_001416 [Bremia lactucae]